MDIALWIFLILLALVLGFYVGYQWHANRFSRPVVNFHKDYLMGLNHLLNEEQDKAVDIFIKVNCYVINFDRHFGSFIPDSCIWFILIMYLLKINFKKSTIRIS